ncbi:hypothetical protein [Geodermatophilus sp. TF02-6]|uniref:hypothetical protein n=1 Tax=Geodermatophilus sp. TF02-6 TaxID=2250575 RepID=UPI001F1DAEF5|nr:hypothetical protein [Geodermatophilus sp. TF02-6]
MPATILDGKATAAAIRTELTERVLALTAAGVPGLVTRDVVEPGAAVLDVGVSRVDGRIAGDVATDVGEVAGFVAPNPGGVGPMTRAMLLHNVVLAAEQAAAADVLPA